MVAPIPAKRGRKPAVATAPATGQVLVFNAWPEITEWIAESNGSVALTELAQQAGLPNSHDPPPANHDATAGLCASGWRTWTLGDRRACFYGR